MSPTATLKLDKRVCIITGAGAGIGLESALVFAKEGAHVVVADINEEAAQRAVELIKSEIEGANEAIAIKCDVSKEGDIEALVAKTVEKFGRLDVMFNNAGIMHSADDNALDTEERVWDMTFNMYASNVKGVWWGSKYAIQAFRNNPGGSKGSLINVASFVALRGAATPQIAYTASKGAVLAMTRELAAVHAREGIRVNALCPGPVRTKLLMDFLDTDEKKDRRLIHVPMGRFSEGIEQAKGALFLASDDSSFVTGTDFLVDGGLASAYVTPLGENSLPAPKNLTPGV